MIALVPARGGSKRVPGKNMRLLNGRPLLVYTLECMPLLGLDRAIVSTDDPATADFAATYAARVRLSTTGHGDADPDIIWVRAVLEEFYPSHPEGLICVLLRPTSPFRTADSVKRALMEFCTPDGTHDSLRAVRPVTEHPGKMWHWDGPGYPITPVLHYSREDVPWHSSPTQNLPRFYVQTSSLEIFWGANVWTHGTIHGRKVIPFFPDALNGFSIDTEQDWQEAEALLARHEVVPPSSPVAVVPYDPAAWGR